MKSVLKYTVLVVLGAVMLSSLYFMVMDYKNAQVYALPALDDERAYGEPRVEPKESFIFPAEKPARITPDAIIIDNVPVVHQMPRWPTGCEVVAVKMLAEFYGVNKTVDEWIQLMPRAPIFWLEGRMHGPDPKEKFAGNPYSAHSYGVYHQPMLKMLEPFFGERLISMTDRPWDDYEDMILAGNPIAIWGTIENLSVVLRDTWITPAGEEYRWRGNGHAMVLVGFSKTHVIVNDPYTGRQRRFDKEAFLERWKSMGKQGIAIRPF